MFKNKIDFYLSNTLINNNILKACLENGVKRVCSTTSTVMFPQDIEFPVSEKDVLKGEPNDLIEGYAWSKRMLQILSKMISTQNEGYIYTTCVVSNIYGIESNFSLDSGQVVSSLIHKCMLKINARLYGQRKRR
jgi:GDP-L-fucose synthase